jgi:hypothetical protein
VSVAANNLSFDGVKLHKYGNKNDPCIDLNTFYRQLKISTEEWFLSSSDHEFVNCTHV